MNAPLTPAEEALREAALEYHRLPVRGKISITPTKPLSNQRDLSLAYSPGVAYACLAIEKDPTLAAEYTARANLVGVVTNGTAVLGLGDIGPLAGKPVMEGKGCLFKKFAGIDVFDIELAEHDPDKLVDIIAALEPTLGGINLEDIKAPECFYIEKKLRERLNIPVFHDDQHGTAIISAAALLNGLELVGKKIDDIKVAVSGAGAAAIACLDVMVGLGVKPSNIFVCDSKGVVREGRGDKLDESKQRYCQKTEARTLADVVKGADVFLGCSAAGVMDEAMVKSMADQPIILALANPEPEIRPELAKASAARLHHRHRAFGLSEPGQQRAVLSVHLPRRAGLRRDQDQRGDEAGLRARDRRAGQGRDQRRGGRCLPRARAEVRRRLPDPHALRRAPDPAHRAGGGQGGDGLRRGDAADRRPGGLPPVAEPLCLPDRHVHAPGVRRGQGGLRARGGPGGLRRGRRRARAARGAGGAGRRPGPADPGRPAGGDPHAHRTRRAAPGAGPRLRGRRPGRRPALPGLLGDLCSG